MPEYIEREAFESALKDNHDAIMQDPTYGVQRQWWEEKRYNRICSILAEVPAAEVVEPDKLKNLIERKYGDLDNTCGCNVNGQWLSVAAIVELIEQAVKE